MNGKWMLAVLALGAGAALAASGGESDDDKEPKEPGEPGPDDAPVEPGAPVEPDEPEVDPDAPTVPIPTPWPDGPQQGGGAPPTPTPDPPANTLPNWHELVSPGDFERWQVQAAVDPNGAALDVGNVVVLGYDPGWFGRPQTLSRLRELAKQSPNVEFAVFSFARSFELFGQPQSPMAYVLTSIAGNGIAAAQPLVSKKKTVGRISDGALQKAVSMAFYGPQANDAEYRIFLTKTGTRVLVLLKRSAQGDWQWGIWYATVANGGPAHAEGGFASKAAAISDASSWVATLKASGVSVGS